MLDSTIITAAVIKWAYIQNWGALLNNPQHVSDCADNLEWRDMPYGEFREEFGALCAAFIVSP